MAILNVALAAALAALLTAPVAVAGEGESLTGRFGLGLMAAYAPGPGIAFRYHFRDGWGLTASAIAWGNATPWDGIPGKELSVFSSVGFGVLRTLSETPDFRIYVPVALSLFFESDAAQVYYGGCGGTGMNSCDLGNRPVNTAFLHAGTGAGFEWNAGSGIGISAELLLTVQIRMIGGASFDWLYPLPGVAVFYHFE
jgi:hypothetical protein